MKSTADLLEMLRVRYELKSTYAVAKFLGQTETSARRWVKGNGSFSDETAMQVADLLDLDPAYVVACIHAERAKHESERKLWERIANMAVAASVLLLIGAVSIGGVPIEAQGPALLTETGAGTVYIMSNAVLEYWAIILPLFALWLCVFLRHTPHPDKKPDHRTL